MIVQGCLNGARSNDYHTALPITAEQIAADGARCVAVGAAELHVHPRGPNGLESLEAVDNTVRALRRKCPGTLIGVSTGAWIEGCVTRTRDCILAWRERPDHASVNLSEPAAPAVMALLDRIGVGIEAGLATVADAERFVSLAERSRVLRILIEIEETNIAAGDKIVNGICQVLAQSGVRRPILLHGFNDTVWHFAAQAGMRCWSTRVGLEDCDRRRDGRRTTDNAALVRDAVDLYANPLPAKV
ncbi:3-keto-5-aminohexanoate cleavage protein [Candidatus Rhodobacter oscarellae]|uniref:3-keto-5-aminohexanoate cleavage protein n=1 Tax=Candidatus Rhodobacter oscarellae TaxID=1675527 RepID=UPI00067087C9|nr:3-keto-5-aminohexanoate cleavage protein [Candidatus Rhodobacter lobularis]